MSAWVDLAWSDRFGRLRFTSAPADRVEQAVAATLLDPADLGWPSLAGPLTLAPDPSGLPSPFEEGREVRLCRLLGPDGEPSPACVRSALDRALDEAAELGFEVIAAMELEFYLLDAETGAPVYDSIENYGIVYGAPYEPVMRQIRALSKCGVPVMSSNPEYGGGQFEVNLRHQAAKEAADSATLLRAYAAAAAAAAGCRVSFVSKPGPEMSGSGLHVHQSLWQGEKNAFWGGEESLSDVGRHYLAGLLKAMGEMAPIGSPTALAYTRRTDGSFCPINVCWGADNRTLAVRALAEHEAETRVEQRDAAADASPHLVLAAQILAGLDGIRRKAEPPPPTTGNAYADDSLPLLPRNIAEALPAFAESDLARRLLTEAGHTSYVEATREETERFLGGFAWQPDPDGGW